MTNLLNILKSRDIALLAKVHLGKAVVFFSSHEWMWELDHKESWATKNWCFWTVALEKTLESPLDSKEIKSVTPKVNQSWIFIGKTDAEAETPIIWPSDVKNWLIGKDPEAGKDWRREEKGTTEDEMAEWHHQLDGHEFEQALELVMDRKALYSAVHGFAKSQTQLSKWTEHIYLSWWLSSKESACNSRDLGSTPGSGRSPGVGNGNPFQYSCLGNPIDRGALQAHGVTKSQTQLSN